MRNTVPFDFQLGPDRNTPSREFLSVVLQSKGWTNLQPTVALNYSAFSAVRLSEVMRNSWSRKPETKTGYRPTGRPLWESSVSLCDKADPAAKGLKIPTDNGTFCARHLNQRRILFGVFESGNGQRPAIWEQCQLAPEAVEDGQGAIEGSNDRMNSDLVGYRIENGMPLPNLWLKAEDEWTSQPLPVQRLTRSGRALDINDARIACGYLDLQIHDRPNRLSCAWESGTRWAIQS